MADPLSVAASVFGLISAGAKIINILGQIAKSASDAPDDCRRLKDDVETIRNVLSQLQLFITGRTRSTRSRTSLILVDQVVVTLAACVTTFSDLDAFTENLHSEAQMGILDRLRWSSKEDEIRRILQRVESHKSSLTLMMTILTCKKQDEAEDKVDALCSLVQKLLEQHEFLRHRLTALDQRQLDYNTALDHSTGEAGDGLPQDSIVAEPASEIRSFVFEEVLNASRVYRNADRNMDDCFSVISSAGRTGSWSMLSGLSLSEMSHITILAIPIYAGDINNSDAYILEPANEIGPKGNPQDPDTDERKVTLSSNIITTNISRPGQKNKWSVTLKLKGLIRASARGQGANNMVFNLPLEESIMLASTRLDSHDENGNTRRDTIPLVVGYTGSFIKAQGMLKHRHPQAFRVAQISISGCELTSYNLTTVVERADIFFLSGNPKRMMKLLNIFSTPPRYGRGHSWTGFTPYDAAGILLRYLKSLPEPVIPYQSYGAFVDIGKLQELGDSHAKETALQTFATLIAALPSHNRTLLLYLIDIMYVFAGPVPTESLVAAFQPSILSGPPGLMDSASQRAADLAVALMVDMSERSDFLGTIYGLVNT